jgi:precorrin-2/cobalt-factor-2 C20-methyltransferase
VLEALGLGDRAHYIERATLGRQLVLPLAQVNPEQVPYFSMILVHKRGEAWR